MTDRSADFRRDRRGVPTPLSRRAAIRALLVAPLASAAVALAEPQPRTASRIPSPARPARPSGPVRVAIAAAERAEAVAAALPSYAATLLKRERIGGSLIDSELTMRFRTDPMAVYLKYVTPHDGRQVLYRRGQNNGLMLVRQTGLAALLGTMSVAPDSALALKENRHPITDAGLASLAGKTAAQWIEASRAVGDAAAIVRRYPKATFGSYACEAYEVIHPQPGPHAGVHKTRLFLDRETGLPVRVQRFDFPSVRDGEPVLLEDYAYLDVETTPLPADAFDPQNSAYGF